jgi:hypothetical protein
MTQSKLVNTLIGKSILEALLVGVVAIVSFLSLFPPTYHGWGEVVPAKQAIAGWAVDSAKPYERLKVQLYLDGSYVDEQISEHSRPDVVTAGWSKDPWHGWQFALPAVVPGVHEVRVYVVTEGEGASRLTLQLLGDPLRFEVLKDGTWRPVAPTVH